MLEPVRAVGSTQLTVSSMQELSNLFETVPDPDLILEKLGRSRADMRSLESDDEISQCLETRREAVLSTQWAIESDNDAIKQWADEQFSTKMDSIIRGAWAAVPYGYSVLRPLYTEGTNGALIDGVDRVEILPFEWFDYLRTAGIGGWRINIRNSGHRVLKPWETEFIYFFTVRGSSWRNPYGEALLTRAYWPFFFRHNSWQFWMKCLERFGTPLLLGKGSDFETLATQLAKAIQDAAIAVGPEDDVAAISVPGAGDIFNQVELALIRRIQKLILGQTLSSDVGSSGSRALGEVHERVRTEKRDADIRLVAPTINRMIGAAVRLRFGDDAEMPRFIIAEERGLEKERAERDATLVNAGILSFTDDYLTKHYGFDPDDFTIPPAGSRNTGAANASLGSGGNGHFGAGDVSFAHRPGHRFTPDQQAVEDNVDRHAVSLHSPISQKDILAAIRQSNSKEDLEQRLAALYEGNSADEFRILMERAVFASSVLGFVAADSEGTEQ